MISPVIDGSSILRRAVVLQLPRPSKSSLDGAPHVPRWCAALGRATGLVAAPSKSAAGSPSRPCLFPRPPDANQPELAR
jgi:hypothetical protein